MIRQKQSEEDKFRSLRLRSMLFCCLVVLLYTDASSVKQLAGLGIGDLSSCNHPVKGCVFMECTCFSLKYQPWDRLQSFVDTELTQDPLVASF